jgi:hypothetical protein
VNTIKGGYNGRDVTVAVRVKILVGELVTEGLTVAVVVGEMNAGVTGEDRTVGMTEDGQEPSLVITVGVVTGAQEDISRQKNKTAFTNAYFAGEKSKGVSLFILSSCVTVKNVHH